MLSALLALPARKERKVSVLLSALVKRFGVSCMHDLSNVGLLCNPLLGSVN